MPNDTYPPYPTWLVAAHRELDTHIHALGEASMESVALPARGPVFDGIDRVIVSAAAAFAAEERELLKRMLTGSRSTSFVALHAHHQRHTLEHNSFLNGLRAFRAQYDRVPRSAIGIYAFASAWIDSHRTDTDNALCAWCGTAPLVPYGAESPQDTP